MPQPILYGARYSVYTRIARLALEEKGVPYAFHEVDIFAPGGPPADYAERHPFARIPAFEHDGFRLFETAAIARYVDDAFEGPPLLPTGSQPRARVQQIVGLLDSYAYRAMVWDVFVERIRAPAQGRAPDEARIAAGLALGETCLRTLEALRGDGPWLVGESLTLADLHAAPMVAPFRLAPEGKAMFERFEGLGSWWEAMQARPSMAATRTPVEEGR